MSLLDTLSTFELRSRVIRREVTGDENGIRRLNNGESSGLWGGILSIVGGIGSAVGWALQKIIGPVLSITATTIWSWIVGGTIYILNFNFGATDQELLAQVETVKSSLAGQLGELVGVTMGWLVCGFVPGAIMFKLNEALALHILKNVSEEALDEILDEIGTLLVMIRNYIAKKTFTNLYIGVRALIKNAANGDSDTLAGGIIERFFKFFPGLGEAAKKWGENKGETWTIAEFIEEKIESIENDLLQNFVEEALEAFGESCVEAGYIVANSIDTFYAQQALSRESILGPNRTIELFPDRSVDEPFREGIILTGRQEILGTQIVQTMATHQQLRHRDVGVMVGEPITTFARKIPANLSLKIVWTNRKDGRQGDITTQTTISNVSKLELRSWAKIKLLAGKDNGRMYGNIMVKLEMSDNSKITVHSATVQAGVSLAKDLAQLSEAGIDWASTRNDLREGELGTFYDDDIIEDPVIVYPYKMYIINKFRILNESREGRITRRGRIETITYPIDLWVENEPPNYEQIIQELITVPGLNPANEFNPLGQ